MIVPQVAGMKPLDAKTALYTAGFSNLRFLFERVEVDPAAHSDKLVDKTFPEAGSDEPIRSLIDIILYDPQPHGH